jgi:hypothetical protein
LFASLKRSQVATENKLLIDGPELPRARFIERTFNQEPDFPILNFICQRERIFEVFDKMAIPFC